MSRHADDRSTSASLKVCMDAGDHSPPHFHVVRDDGRGCMIRLDTLQLLRGTIDGKSLAQAVSWARQHGDLLAAAWEQLNERD